MNPHPERHALISRLQARVQEMTSPYNGTVFRFVDPNFTSVDDQFSGIGTHQADGRWMLKSKRQVAYTSLLPETALAEALAANRYYGFPDHRSAPLVFVTAQANLKQVIDLREGANRQRLLLSEATILETDWRKENHQGQESVTQAWGWAFHLSEIEGILCPSAAHPSGSNLIAFPEHFDRVSRLKVLCKVDWPR